MKYSFFPQNIGYLESSSNNRNSYYFECKFYRDIFQASYKFFLKIWILQRQFYIALHSTPLLLLWNNMSFWSIGHFRVRFSLCFKTSLSAKPFIWNWVLHAVSFSCKSKSFHKNGFALSLALKQRNKGTRKWLIWWSVFIYGVLHSLSLVFFF